MSVFKDTLRAFWKFRGVRLPSRSLTFKNNYMKYLIKSIWNDTNPLLALFIYKLMLMSFIGILFILYQTIFNGVTINF